MKEPDPLKTIHSFLEQSALNFPGKQAVVFESEARTYAELNADANCVRDFLLDQCAKGDRVGILLDNSINFLKFYFGVLKSWCVAVIFGQNVSDKNLIYEIEDCSPKILFYESKFSDKVTRTNLIQKLKLIDITQLELGVVRGGPAPNVVEQDVSTIIYTSGTTALPKGVKLRHCNVVSATKNMNEFMKITSEDIYLSVLPLSHSFGLGNIHVSFMVGGKVIIERNAINLKKILGHIISEKVTFFAAVPATLKQIVDNYFELFTRCGSMLGIIVSNTNALSRELIAAITTGLKNTRFCYYYGLTEASRSSFIDFHAHPNRLDSVGQATPNTQIQIRDGGKILGAGQRGEICVFGRHVIKEYWNNAEASKKIADGWLYTGDYGYLDKEGFLFIVGRNDDLINVGGEKVLPQEIESAVKAVSGIKEVVAVGVPDSTLNEVVALFVVPDGGINELALKESIMRTAKSQLETYKLPWQIIIVGEIPKTDSGKIKRNELKRMVVKN